MLTLRERASCLSQSHAFTLLGSGTALPLITSTMLTLIVVPVAYTYADDVATWLRRRAGARDTGEVHGAERYAT